jgi:hypothetical protein
LPTGPSNTFTALPASLRIGEFKVGCAQPGVAVSLDGKPQHVVAADRPGFVPQSVHVVVAGRAVTTHRIALVSLDAAAHLEYPRPRWIAWTVASGGAAIALGGLGFYLAGRNQMDAFHSDFASVCATGCEADLASHPLLRRERDSAVLQGKIAVSMMAAGDRGRRRRARDRQPAGPHAAATRARADAGRRRGGHRLAVLAAVGRSAGRTRARSARRGLLRGWASWPRPPNHHPSCADGARYVRDKTRPIQITVAAPTPSCSRTPTAPSRWRLATVSHYRASSDHHRPLVTHGEHRLTIEQGHLN